MLESGEQTPGAVLRCAYIEQEIGEYEESISRTNQVIFGAQRSDPEVEAIARWLRARAFAHEDLTTDSDRELRRARDMTRDPRLLAAIEKDLTPATAAPKKRPQLAIYSRDQWRAKNANAGNMKRMNGINRITIHHSATAAHGRSTTAAAGAIRGIQLHHQQTNGWGDIGYHYLIDTSGRVWIGRTIDWQGAHAGGPARNQHNVGICLLGNFTPDAQGEPPAAQMRAMEELIRSLCAQYDIPGNQVLTHRELRTTDCPGPYLQVAIQRLRKRLEAEHVAATTPRPR